MSRAPLGRAARALGAMVAALALALPGAPLLAAESADPARLAQVRAAFLLNFVRYTEWPAAAFESPESPIYVVVVDDDAVAGALEQLSARAGTTAGRQLRVVKLRAPGGAAEERAAFAALLRRSHVVYLGEEPDGELVEAVAGASVLTVAADEEFVREGGMISLLLEGSHVTFDVNATAIRERGLLLSSRVLRLARSVRSER